MDIKNNLCLNLGTILILVLLVIFICYCNPNLRVIVFSYCEMIGILLILISQINEKKTIENQQHNRKIDLEINKIQGKYRSEVKRLMKEQVIKRKGDKSIKMTYPDIISPKDKLKITELKKGRKNTYWLFKDSNKFLSGIKEISNRKDMFKELRATEVIGYIILFFGFTIQFWFSLNTT